MIGHELAVKVCLLRLKKAIENDHCLFVERHKNTQALFDLGLDLDTFYSVLLKLTPAEYAAGPEPDDDGSDGQVWKFSHPIGGEAVYVKVKFFTIGEQDWVKILSFHPSSEES